MALGSGGGGASSTTKKEKAPTTGAPTELRGSPPRSTSHSRPSDRRPPGRCELTAPAIPCRGSFMEATNGSRRQQNRVAETPNRPKSPDLATNGNTRQQTGQTSHARGRRFETRRAHR